MTAAGTQYEHNNQQGAGSCCTFLIESLHSPTYWWHLWLLHTWGDQGEGKHSRNSVAEVWTWSWAGERISTSGVSPFPLKSGLSYFSACMPYGGIGKHHYVGYPRKIPCYYVKAPVLYRIEKVRANSASATFLSVHRVPLALSPCLLSSSYLIITSSSLTRKLREGG